MKREDIWRTIDGKTFSSEEEAKEHEKEIVEQNLVSYEQQIEYISNMLDDYITTMELDIADDWSSKYDTKYFTGITSLMGLIYKVCPAGRVEEILNDLDYFRLNGQHKELID